MMAGLLVAPLRYAQATESPSPQPPTVTISAPAACGIKNGTDSITFSGFGPSGATLRSAVFRAFRADGSQLGRDVDLMTRHEIQMTESTDKTVLSGSTGAGPFGGDPLLNPEAVALQAIVTIVKDGAVSAESFSNTLSIDQGVPRFLGAETASPTTVVVRFSEDVTARNGDFAGDWTVNDQRASQIAGQGKTRTLTLSPLQKLGEDDTPMVEFDWIDPRAMYVDCVGNDLADPLSRQAIDRIPPVTPVIQTVDGKNAGSEVFSRSTNPSIVVNQDTAEDGHTVHLFRETESAPAFDPDMDEEIGKAGVDNGVATDFSNLTPFTNDGTYTLYAMATDRNGNVSTDSGGNPAADTTTFTLDRIAPQQVDARSTGSKVAVTFTEGLTGANDKSQWTITGCPTGCTIASVTGSGDTRVLTLLTGQVAPNGASVAWTRPGTGGYTDKAENPLESFNSLTTQGFIAKTIDVVEETASPAAGTTYTLHISVLDDLNQAKAGTVVGVRAFEGPSKQKDFDGNGPNPTGTIGSCFTGSDGTCTFQYASNAADLDKLQAWIDSDDNVATVEAPFPEALADEDPDSKPNQDVVEVRWVMESAQLLLDATPETATSPAGHPHVVTAQVNATDGDIQNTPRAAIESVTVGLRATSGPNAGFLDTCETGADGRCELTYNSTQTGTDQLQAWIDRNADGVASAAETGDSTERLDADGTPLINQPNQDVMTKTWTVPDVLRLNVEPEESSQDPGKTVFLDLHVVDGSGRAVRAASVLARIFSGPNAGKQLDCQTDSLGSCVVSYTSASGGADLIQAWIDSDGDGTSDEAKTFEPISESGGQDDPGQDVVRVTWRAPDLAIHVTPKTSTNAVGTTRSFEISAVDNQGNPKGAVSIVGRVFSGPNSGAQVMQCSTSMAGVCSISYNSTKVGSDVLQVWADLDGDGTPNGSPTPEPANASDSTDQPTQDVATVDWVTKGADLVLDANPETGDATSGAQYELTLSVATASGAPVEGALLAARVTDGPSASSTSIGSCASGASGACTLKYASRSAGTDTVVTWIDVDGNKSSNEITGSPEPRDAAGPLDVKNQDTVAVSWTGIARGITLESSSPTARFGRKTILSGQITGDNACSTPSVQILRRIGQTFENFKSTAASSNGRYELTIRPKKNATYRALVADTDQCGGATSSDLAIRVRASVTAEAFRTRIPADTCTAITGMVRPSKRGSRVVLQKRGALAWARVDATKLAGDSTFSFPVCVGANGSDSYRVKWSGDRSNLGATSRSVRISVR
jgi:hypothetical protein